VSALAEVRQRAEIPISDDRRSRGVDMTYEFATHQIPTTGIISIRDQIVPDAFPAFLGGAFPELFEFVGRHGIATLGHPFVMYHAFGPDVIDAEVCVPVAAPGPTTDRIQARTLPATEVVRTLHIGPYEELGSAYAALTEWVSDHGFVSGAPVRERYLTGVTDDVPPSAYRTELDMPIEPAATAAASDRQDPVGSVR
jgi:effector-binding domain-containing protein